MDNKYADFGDQDLEDQTERLYKKVQKKMRMKDAAKEFLASSEYSAAQKVLQSLLKLTDDTDARMSVLLQLAECDVMIDRKISEETNERMISLLDTNGISCHEMREMAEQMDGVQTVIAYFYACRLFKNDSSDGRLLKTAEHCITSAARNIEKLSKEGAKPKAFKISRLLCLMYEDMKQIPPDNAQLKAACIGECAAKLGYTLNRMGKYDDAYSIMMDGRKQMESLVGDSAPAHHTYATMANNISAVLLRQDNYREALSYTRKAVAEIQLAQDMDLQTKKSRIQNYKEALEKELRNHSWVERDMPTASDKRPFAGSMGGRGGGFGTDFPRRPERPTDDTDLTSTGIPKWGSTREGRAFETDFSRRRDRPTEDFKRTDTEKPKWAPPEYEGLSETYFSRRQERPTADSNLSDTEKPKGATPERAGMSETDFSHRQERAGDSNLKDTGKPKNVSDTAVHVGGGIYVDHTKPLRVRYKVFEGSFEGEKVAVKRFDWSEKCRKDTEIMMSLKTHPNIVQFKAYAEFESKECPGTIIIYLAMELCDKTTLYELAKDETFSQDERLRSLLDFTKGLSEIHRNDIIHGDLKPHNILRSLDGKAMKIGDFAMSEKLEHGRTHRTIALSQSTRYGWVAPEGKLTKGSDVFAAGLIYYYVLSHGEALDQHRDFSKLKCDDVNVASDLISRMTDLDAEKRPTAEECCESALFQRFGE